ncbi:LAME_0F02498g1_1 [Lachancea meyersii CBS 8951]|uniref:SAGA complex subunit Spt7 n=1 Tax=Lachancea meyersii CBS 8951 TaxID=1266667 RepID=A0A1G4JQJ9_9SACH|nr:LAME_0F02498g1_1 [Lachancea meyersii CBS 8951]
MDRRVPTVYYQKTDPSLLLEYAEQLSQSGTFNQFLTPQQLIVLNKVLAIQDPAHKRRVWLELVNSNVVLEVVKKIERSTGHLLEKAATAKDLTTENDEHNTKVSASVVDTPSGNISKSLKTSNPVQQNEEDVEAIKKDSELSLDADFSEVDLENLQQQMSGAEFIGNLSLKVRYVLWESAIDPLCQTSSGEMQLRLPLEDAAHESERAEKAENGKAQTVDVRRNEEEEDDYDDENYDEERNISDQKDQTQKSSNANEPQAFYDENGRFVFVLEISRDTLSALGLTNTQAVIENFNKIYHNFENDRETLLKRLKLEESDKLLEPSKKRLRSEADNPSEEELEQLPSSDSDFKKSKLQTSDTPALAVNLGSANLSLKHLLASIQDNKSKLNISDYELRHLIMDVRKNRSKWASDDKIGQEELYDACEKVVLELRNFTEHSTAFLNKVSKREAPNYYQIIKKPMDLNTVLKKLKTYQYTSKQAFVDDVMLIWKNCLKYNSDPKHFLRTHAIAMQKKSLALIPLIPDITIRDRSEVEKELEDIDKENDKEDEAEEEASGTGRKGGNVRGIKQDEEEASPSSSTKGSDATDSLQKASTDKNQNLETESGANDTTDDKDISSQFAAKSKFVAGKEPQRLQESTTETTENGESKASKAIEGPTHTEEQSSIDKESNSQKADQGDGEFSDEEEDDEDDDEEGDLGSNMYLVEKDDDKDDLELSTWKNSTASVRAELCIKRAGLFNGNGINSKAPAILKNPSKMKDFDQLVKEYKDQQDAELQRRNLEQESIMKNGFGTVVKQEEEENSLLQAQQSSSMSNENDVEKASAEIELDDVNFLSEYNVANAVPKLRYTGLDDNLIDLEESKLVESILSQGNLAETAYLANKGKGLNPKINSNIQLIQEIRHICHKIALIRMLQNPQNSSQQIKSNSSNPNGQIWDTHKYKYTSLDDSIDLDPVSRLPTRNNKQDKHLICRLMHRNVSKIAMSNGFESTQPVAISMLTEIAWEYLSNLVKTIKIHHESTSLNPKKPYEILQMSLLENGIKKPDDLYSYMEAEFVKKHNKLKDIKLKLNNFLKELLRPTLQELSEKNFEDESQSFMTGDFSSEITGEDFFGFRDLGLDREFGVLSNSVPMQLLTFQFQGKGSEDKVQDKKIQPEEFNDVTYAEVSANSIHEGQFWRTLQPLLEKALARFRAYEVKNGKAKVSDFDPDKHPDVSYQILTEDEERPSKSKSSGKPRLPPTGKISTNYRKKPVSDAFFAPDLPQEPILPQQGNEQGSNDSQVGEPRDLQPTSSNGDHGSSRKNDSFTLSLPKVSK